MFLIFPLDKRERAMGLYGLVIAFAPAIGPSLSGYLVDNFPWRRVFYVVFPITIVIIIAASFLLKNVTKLTHPKIDTLFIILSMIGFDGLLYGFSSAGSEGWTSTSVIIAIVVGTITLFMFFTRQSKLDEPILEFRVFESKIFVLTTTLDMIVSQR